MFLFQYGSKKCDEKSLKFTAIQPRKRRKYKSRIFSTSVSPIEKHCSKIQTCLHAELRFIVCKNMNGPYFLFAIFQNIGVHIE
jgi:hypothetical protein